MKKACTRIVSLLIILTMLLSFIPSVCVESRAATESQKNIADWADYYYNATWVCQKTVSGWKGEHTFTKGQTYHIPYGQPGDAGKYIGYAATLEEFLEAAADANSSFYTLRSGYGSNTSVYYANDCSAFVSSCWCVSRHVTSTIPSISTYLGKATEANIKKYLQLGDALNSTSVAHAVLVSDIIYDTNGNITKIEITEQTPPQLKRTYFTPASLAGKYSSAYGIYRYEGAVPAAPEQGYATKCTAYASHCKVQITAAAAVMSLPCTTGVDSGSTQLKTAAVGETYTATRLYKNTAGELWYRLQLSGGVGYIAAKNTKYVKQLVNDITLSGANTPNGIVKGNSFAIKGTVIAAYNGLTSVSAYVHQGFGTSGSKLTGASDTAYGLSYNLASSTIDKNTKFGSLPTGNHTLAISAAYKGSYVDASGAIKTNTGTVHVSSAYFVVIASSVSQSSCSHSYKSYTVKAATCTAKGLQVKSCATCGLVSKSDIAMKSHTYGSWTVVNATCTAAGSKTRTCTACGKVEKQTIAVIGHSYATEIISATCQEYDRIRYTCKNCGDSYTAYAHEVMQSWQETKPEGVDESQLETKTQYRYSDYTNVTSNTPTPDGYNQISLVWEKTGSGTINYVSSWPAGFDTTNSLYTTYKKTPKTASQTTTAKTTIDSNKVVGYIYYHWCRGSYSAGPINRLTSTTKTDTFCAFHGFYSTTNPSTLTLSSGGDRYQYNNSTCCKDTYWYYYIPVYRQTYTTYKAVYTYEGWSPWSAWSDTAYTASDTRQVQTRTLYRYTNPQLGDHDYVDGVCSVCGDTLIPPAVPSVELKYPALSFEDEILLNVYFEPVDLEGVAPEDMGLITFTGEVAEGTVDNADGVFPGAVLDSNNGYYYVRTGGIAAKNLGDEIYFRVYVKQEDGTYLYSKMVNYSPKTYAYSLVNGEYADDMKALAVSMLNYGAAAQTYFGYKADALVNTELTAEQQALVEAYSAEMVSPVISADVSKVGIFTNSGGFSRRYPAVSFEGAFSINYFFTPGNIVDGDLVLYYWNQAAYNGAEVLTTDNATGALLMTGDGERQADVTGIAAKDLDGTVYVAAVYESDGTAYCSGVLAYSIGAYCVDRAANGTADMQTFAAATAVYGYYAKAYFFK